MYLSPPSSTPTRLHWTYFFFSLPDSAINHNINQYEIGPFLTASQALNGLLTDVGMVRKCFGNEPLEDMTMERVRVEEFKESLYEDCGWVNLVFFRVSLSIFSLEALYISWVWGVFILMCVWNAKSQFFQNRAGWWLSLATWLSREFKPWTN